MENGSNCFELQNVAPDAPVRTDSGRVIDGSATSQFVASINECETRLLTKELPIELESSSINFRDRFLTVLVRTFAAN